MGNSCSRPAVLAVKIIQEENVMVTTKYFWLGVKKKIVIQNKFTPKYMQQL